MSASSNPPTFTLLTDFGSRDHYAGVVKGVILRVKPRDPAGSRRNLFSLSAAQAWSPARKVPA